jgi:16S rRNA U1498 N3-methylase RsmE
MKSTLNTEEAMLISKLSSIKLENMELTVDDLVEMGVETLKNELRARGKDFRK